MRVLIDERAPRAIKKHLTNHGHEVSDGSGIGLVWKAERLLNLAEASAFDVLVAVDTNLHYRQNLADRKSPL